MVLTALALLESSTMASSDSRSSTSVLDDGDVSADAKAADAITKLATPLVIRTDGQSLQADTNSYTDNLIINLCFALNMSGLVCNCVRNNNCGYCIPSYWCQETGLNP